MNTIPLILASNSPRRKQLLEQVGFHFTVIPSQVHEDFSLPLEPSRFACHYAEKKAGAIAPAHPEAVVLGADTIVVLENEILGKPKDKEDSFRMLSNLSGRSHTVITGVSLHWHQKDIIDTFHEATTVTFNTLSKEDIYYYIERYNPLDKAGSYGIQDWFSVCIRRVEGCFYNVVGLPLARVYEHMKQLGVVSL
jgi:septum formation protein